MEKDFGIVLLAAGSSSRLGRPKQSLDFNGKTLLRHSIDVAIASDIGSIVVVLGANAASLSRELPEEKVFHVINENWRDGMASSLVCGVKALVKLKPAIEGLILMVCDQVYVTAALINEVILAQQNTHCPIVACTYGGAFGPPTFFTKRILPELMELRGDTGAKSIIKKYAAEVKFIPFPEGKIDVDTELDYQHLFKK